MNDKNISIYAPLDDKADIRLLLLHPGPKSALICCTLAHAKVSSKPIYEALSYVWGPEKEGSTINLNNRILSVRPNLWLALRQLRLPCDIRCLWLMLCARNYQVSRMGEIYSEAKVVHVWLGLSGPYTMAALELLIRAGKGPKNRPRDGDAENATRGMIDIMCRQYWQRLWIIQDYVLANDLMIHCGDFELPWRLLALYNEYHVWKKGALGQHAADVIWERKKFRAPREDGTSEQLRKPQPLLEALKFHRDAKCFDSRDMIFGLRSVAPACCQECNPVDYSATTLAICRRLFEHHINIHKTWHFGYEGLIWFTREVYNIVLAGISQEHLTKLYHEIEDEVGKQPTQENPTDFKLKSFAHSFARVQWVSPPLQSLSAFDQVLDLFKDLWQEFSRQPISATMGSFLQEEYKWKKLVAAALPKVNFIDRSCSFRVPDDFKYDSAKGILEKWKNPPTSSVAPQALLWKDQESKAARKVLQLLKLASCLLQDQKSRYRDCVLFIASGNGVESDMIGFAPAKTTPQNLLYKLDSCRDETVIVSNFAGTTKLVVMAAPLIDPYKDNSMYIAFLLCIQIDIETLQILSTTQLRQAASRQTIG